MKSLFSATGKRWQSLSLFSRNLVINLFLGLSVVFVLWLFSDSPWLMEMEDASMDWLMQINENIIPSIQENNIPPVVILDVDDKTYYNWGEPLFTPRDRLKNMIAAAVNAKARLVIVDLEVSQKTPVEGSQLHPSDQVLKDYLENYIIECKGKIDNCPTIILRRTFSTKSSPVPILRTSFLDDIVTTQAAPYVQWATAQFYPAGDQVVRRWRLWQPACTPYTQPALVPSIELLAMAEINEGCTATGLQKALQSFQLKNCHDKYGHPTLPETFEFCGLTVNTKDGWGLSRRIMFRLPWLVEGKPPTLPYVALDKNAVPTLTIFSAQPYTESPPQASSEELTGSIVIIAGSYHEMDDIYSTPLGDMPSAIIVINAIHSLLRHEEVELLPIVGLLIIVLFVAILSTLFEIFPFYLIMIVLSTLTIFVLLPLTMIFFHYGMWLSFALPLFVVSIYQVIAKYNQSHVPHSPI